MAHHQRSCQAQRVRAGRTAIDFIRQAPYDARSSLPDTEDTVGPSMPFHMQPLLAGVAASFVLGLLWFGLIFGRLWPRAMGLEKPPGALAIVRSSALNLVSTFVLAVALTFGVNVWRPSTWGAGMDATPWHYALFAATYGWVGYVIPSLLNGVAFGKMRWGAFAIGAVYQLLCMQVIAMLIAYWT